MLPYLKYGVKTPRQICWQTTALSKAGLGWKPRCSSPYGQATQENSNFRNAIQNHWVFVKTAYNWGMFILVSCGITKQKLKEVPVRLKIQILIWKEKQCWCSQPRRDPTDFCNHGIFWQEKKRSFIIYQAEKTWQEDHSIEMPIVLIKLRHRLRVARLTLKVRLEFPPRGNKIPPAMVDLITMLVLGLELSLHLSLNLQVNTCKILATISLGFRKSSFSRRIPFSE